MTPGMITITYLVAGVFFIRALGGLSKQATASVGNLYGIAGMILAIVVTAISWLTHGTPTFGTIVLALALFGGGTLGAGLARRVEMTGMPELVAVLHSFVGLAAVFVGVSSHLSPQGEELHGDLLTVHRVEIWVGIAVGAITFTGSVIAWGKLRSLISGKPLLLAGRHALNAAIALAIIGLAVPFLGSTGAAEGMPYIGAMIVLAGVLGVHLVMAIGGADLPVVVSLLNSYSGWAAAAAGFMLANDLLIVTGALVGASGTSSLSSCAER